MTITTRKAISWLEIKVSDGGASISEDCDQESLLDMAFQFISAAQDCLKMSDNPLAEDMARNAQELLEQIEEAESLD